MTWRTHYSGAASEDRLQVSHTLRGGIECQRVLLPRWPPEPEPRLPLAVMQHTDEALGKGLGNTGPAPRPNGPTGVAVRDATDYEGVEVLALEAAALARPVRGGAVVGLVALHLRRGQELVLCPANRDGDADRALDLL